MEGRYLGNLREVQGAFGSSGEPWVTYPPSLKNCLINSEP